MFRDVFWTPVEDIGLEHLRLTEDRAGIAAESVVVGTHDGEPFRISYEIDCARDWRPRRVHVTTLGRPARSITLRADGEGTWIDEQGSELPVLDGAVDVDISATPFTNTLPIRRLKLDRAESAELNVAYICVPELTFEVDTQRYTCLDPSDSDTPVSIRPMKTVVGIDSTWSRVSLLPSWRSIQTASSSSITVYSPASGSTDTRGLSRLSEIPIRGHSLMGTV